MKKEPNEGKGMKERERRKGYIWKEGGRRIDG